MLPLFTDPEKLRRPPIAVEIHLLPPLLVEFVPLMLSMPKAVMPPDCNGMADGCISSTLSTDFRLDMYSIKELSSSSYESSRSSRELGASRGDAM